MCVDVCVCVCVCVRAFVCACVRVWGGVDVGGWIYEGVDLCAVWVLRSQGLFRCTFSFVQFLTRKTTQITILTSPLIH